MGYTSYHDLLIEEFERRKRVNPAYSLRAYARDLDFSASRLSQVLNRKQGISVEAAKILTVKLKLCEEKAKWFCDSAGALHSRNYQQRLEYSSKIQTSAKVLSELDPESFEMISNWYYFAILELTHHKDFRHDEQWIAQTLEMTEDEVREAIARLKSLELLVEENGKLQKKAATLVIPNDYSSLALRKLNSQLMKKSMERELLEFSSTIFAVKKERMPEFQERLKALKKYFASSGLDGQEKDAVCCLGIQFYEVTK